MALAGQLYRALYPFGPTDDDDDLTFKAGAVILVTNKDAGDGWWEGELDGSTGTFPASYVQSLSGTTKAFTAPEDTDPVQAAGEAEPKAALEPEGAAASATPPAAGGAGSPRSAMADPKRRKNKSLSWALDHNVQEYTFAKAEYARGMDNLDHRTMERNHMQWEREEPEEKLRQMFVAFEAWERNLPPGTKCPQRLEYEAKIAKENADRDDARRKFKAAREAKRKAQQQAEQPAPEGVANAPAEATQLAAVPPPDTVPDAAAAGVDARAPAPPTPTSEKTEPAAAAETAVVDRPDPAAPFVDLQRRLQEQAAALAKDDGRGIEGYTMRFRDLDIEDRRRFSASLCQVAVSRPECNRYKDILPYDEFRVPLNGNSGYLNASFVHDLLPGAPTYLAAQGPKPQTVGHFWKAIAEHKCVAIAMLTRCIENNKLKCEEYWPTPGRSLFFEADDGGPAVGVVGNAVVEHELWVERRFTVVTESSAHDVVQLHFTGWPDHGVPERPCDAIKFVQEIMRIERAVGAASRAPLVVHCSAGVGRTGVFAVLHAIMTYLPTYAAAADTPMLDIMGMVRHLRKSRRYMVQTIDQFRFCFAATVELIGEFVDVVRATADKSASGEAVPAAAQASPKEPGLHHSVLANQLKQSLRREFDANRARSELQKDLLELSTGVRDAAVAADLREDLALAQQRVLFMAKRNKEQALEADELHSTLRDKDEQLKSMAAHLGDLQFEVDAKNDEIESLRKQLVTAHSDDSYLRQLPTAPAPDYIAVGGVDEDNEAGYVDLLPDGPATPKDDDGGELGFGDAPAAEATPQMVVDGVGSESDSEL
mmetsp:Transcript_20375/g.52916  ORF Transcript_20375/g.52916 Transcript_20375/m.52916 type:complete len:822 (-) Transcript_20375:18-2483(-)